MSLRTTDHYGKGYNILPHDEAATDRTDRIAAFINWVNQSFTPVHLTSRCPYCEMYMMDGHSKGCAALWPGLNRYLYRRS